MLGTGKERHKIQPKQKAKSKANKKKWEIQQDDYYSRQ